MAINQYSKIFLTGASGFVGQHTIKLLISQGYTQITCLTRQPIDKISEKYPCQWITGDLSNLTFLEEQLADKDVIINLAADVTFSTNNKKQFLQNAVTTTANLVNAALYTGIKKMIHISSVAAIGRKKQKDYIDEKVLFSHSPYDTTYGLAKFLGEQEVWRGHAEGLNATVLCPSMILGTGDWNRSSIKLFQKIHNGLKYFPTGITGWVSVNDVANAVSKCLQGDFSGERFIISAENRSYQDIFSLIATAVQAQKPIKALTPALGKTLIAIDKLRSLFSKEDPLLTKETLMSTSVESIYDNSKSIKELGLQYANINETIRQAGKAYLETVK